MRKIHFTLFFLAVLIISFSFYFESLNYYFFQDDFFEINISKAASLIDYLSFFTFRNDIIAYRPISLQNYFFASLSLFDLNPGAFRIITFALFFASSLLISKVIFQLTKSNKIALLTAVFWLLSAIHFMTLSWIAAAYNITGTFFWLTTSLFFLNYLKNNSKHYYIFAIFSFLATIGSFEFSITWPAIWGLYLMIVKRWKISKITAQLSPFIIISIVYLILRLFLITVPQISEYEISISVESLKALFWYFQWTFNIPEEFKKQIVHSLIVFNPKFVNEFQSLIIKTYTGALIVLLFSLVSPLYRVFRKKSKPNLNLLFFALSWFVVGITPVLVLPNHTFSMYLTLSSIGLYFCISYLLVKFTSNKVILLTVLTFLFTSYTTLSFYKMNSWIINAQKTSKKFDVNMKSLYPTIPDDSIILYPLNSNWEKQALLGNHSIRAIYNNPTLLIYYNKDELIRDIKKSKMNRKIYVYPSL